MSEFDRLAFKSHVSRFVLDGERVLLITEGDDKVLLKGSVYSFLVPLLDGSKTADEIAEQLGPDHGLERVYFAIMTLQSKGFLATKSAGIPLAESAFWQSLGIDDSYAHVTLRNTPVAVVALEKAEKEASALRVALEALDINIGDEHSAKLTIVAVPDYLHPGLASIAMKFRSRNLPWICVKIVGHTPWFGPVWLHNGGPCWACLMRRLHENRMPEVAVQRLGKDYPVVSICSLPSTIASAANIAATEIAKWIVAPDQGRLKDSVCTLDLLDLRISHHKVQRLNDCGQCGNALEPSSVGHVGLRPLTLQSRIKRHISDGGHRTKLPQETFHRLEHLVSPITGICPDLRKVEVSSGSNVYQIKQNVPLSRGVREGVQLWKRDGAAGKGETDIQAKVSCVAEAIERYSSIYRGTEARINAKFSELDRAIHPERLLNFSSNQYRTREQWNKTNPGFNWVPEEFDDSAIIDWSPAWCLSDQTIRWLPTAYCYFAYEAPTSKCFCRSDSNGLAAGNNLEEAILQGFLELVERDAMAIFWYNRIRRPGVDLASFKNPYFDYMQTRHGDLGRCLQVIDITNDFEIPVFFAYSCDRAGREIAMGLGAHMDPRLAISRAISELNQMEPVVELWNRTPPEERPRDLDDQHIANWLEHATLDNQPYLQPADQSLHPASGFEYMYDRDVLSDVERCLSILHSKDMELIVLELTRPDVDFPTVRVTVPGMRHFWARFAPGRLYDVPVELGWLPEPRSEAELNPFPLFL